MEDSVFTKIIKGEIPCYKIYEDDQVIAFLDILPIQPGQVLLVPKQQIERLWQVPEPLYAHLWNVARLIAQHQQDAFSPDRVGVLVDGEAVPHAHIKLVPLNGPHDINASPPSDPDHNALAVIAAKLKFQNL